MQINPKIKRQLRWQNNFFVLLFLAVIGLLAWVSLQYEFNADWTNNKRNTPSDATITLLEKITAPILIQGFVSNENKTLAAEISHLVQGYQRFKTNITLQFVDPKIELALAREIGVRNEGELLIHFEDRQEHVLAATEKNLTNAIQRLARIQENWLLFLEGHDERSPYGGSNFDYSTWHDIMKSKGILVRTYNLASNPNIPENTAALVIADPQKPLLPGEVRIILDFLESGGNLLWLLEPNSEQGLEPLAEMLGIERLQGMVVDPNTQLLGINDPRFTLIPEYPRNTITENLNSMSVFPTAQALEFFGDDTWDASTLLETLPRTWAESEEITADVSLDPSQDIPGPLVIGLSLSRSTDDKDDELDLDTLAPAGNEENEQMLNEQRVIVIGDSDFSSDAYIGQAGNLDFAMNLINWLTKSDAFISIPNKTSIDHSLNLSKTKQMIIGFGFLLVIPLSLLLIGLFIWFRRKNA